MISCFYVLFHSLFWEPIGINPRRLDSWTTTVDKVYSHLSSWKNKFISYGSSIVLLNAILSSILVYLFSFYKAPKVVIHELIKIQRAFIWKGEENKRQINRVCVHRCVNRKRKVVCVSNIMRPSISLYLENGHGESWISKIFDDLNS